MNKQFTFRACVGELRIASGLWYTPIGKTPQECTYCDWCIKNGCMSINDVYQLDKVFGCNCDCPHQKTHGTLEPYICPDHQNNVIQCGYCHCLECGMYQLLHHDENGHCCQLPPESKGIQYCSLCSAFDGICQFCGKKEIL